MSKWMMIVSIDLLCICLLLASRVQICTGLLLFLNVIGWVLIYIGDQYDGDE